MSKTFTIKVDGLQGVLKNLERYEKATTDKVDNELTVAAKNIAAEAISKAPKNTGGLSSGIVANTGTKFNKSVESKANFSAFVEFGTGSGVFKGTYSFTQDQKAFAKQFYVSGKGKMKSWAFLFPAFMAEIPKLVKRLRDAIRD